MVCSCISNSLATTPSAPWSRLCRVLCVTCSLVFVWLPWSVVAWQQVFDQVRSCACYAGSWSSIVSTFCCTDDLQDTRYFMELICSVPAEPLPMQILALANNAGKANQVSSCKLTVADSYGSKAHKLWGSCLPLQMCHAIAGCSDDLCSIG